MPSPNRKEVTKALRDRRRASGICTECTQKAVEGKTLCQKHLERARRYELTPKGKAAKSERLARYRAEHKALGLCSECNEKALEGKSRCEKHHRYAIERCRKSSRRIISAKKAEGICVYKGCNSIALDGRSYCGYHDEVRAEAREKLLNKRRDAGLCLCGREIKPTLKDDGTPYRTCYHCRSDKSRRQKEDYANKKPWVVSGAQKRKKQRERNAALGLCACGNPVKEGVNRYGSAYSTCETCYKVRHEYNHRAHRDRIRNKGVIS